MGVATVGLLHHVVRRTTGSAAAGLVAGAVMALTPVAVADVPVQQPRRPADPADGRRSGRHPARHRGLRRRARATRSAGSSLGGALVGLAFLTKMLQAFLVLPALALAYLLFARTSWGKRVGHLLVAFGSMLLAGGWWIAIVELWPASSRPWIGGSQDNSILELTLGYNGLGRLNGDETGSVGGGAGGRRRLGRRPACSACSTARSAARSRGCSRPPWCSARAALWFARRDNRRAVGAHAVAHLARRHRADLQPDGRHLPRLLHRRPRPGGRRPRRHRRLGALAPPRVVRRLRRSSPSRTALTSVLGFYLLDRADDFVPWLKWVVARRRPGGRPRASPGSRTCRVGSPSARPLLALVATLAGPAAYAVSTAAQPHTGSIPSAGPASSGGPGGMPGGPGGRPGGGPAAGTRQAPPGTTQTQARGPAAEAERAACSTAAPRPPR